MYRVLIFIFLVTPLFAIRNFERFYCGAENIGVGNANISEVSENSAINNPSIIPALYSTNKNFIFSYEVFSTFKIVDILALNFRYDFDIFPFFSIIIPKESYGFAISLENIYYSPDSTFDLKFIKISLGYLISKNISVGISPGVLVGLENNGNGLSYGLQLSATWKLTENIQLGGYYLYLDQLEWNITPYGEKLREKFPDEINLGLTYKINKDAFFYFSIANSFYNQSTFILDEKVLTPSWNSNFIYLKPFLGFRFLERITGGHFSLGCYLDYFITDSGILPQYRLTFGFRGYAKRLKYNISFTDSYIISLFYKENIPRENININFSFFF